MNTPDTGESRMNRLNEVDEQWFRDLVKKERSVHDVLSCGFHLDWFGKLLAELDAVRAELGKRDNEVLRQRLSRAIAALTGLVKHGKPEENGDWACRECKPHSDILQEGFQCSYHAALTLIEESKSWRGNG